MTQHRENIRIKVEGDHVTMVFNAKGWTNVHTRLAEHLGSAAEGDQIDIGELIGNAVTQAVYAYYPKHPESTTRLIGSWEQAELEDTASPKPVTPK